MNINDYVRWRGDFTFKEVPINEIDVACFSMIVYCRFENIKNFKNLKTIQDWAKVFEGENKEDKYNKLLIQMGNSKRFKNVTISNIKYVKSHSPLVQFTGACFNYRPLKTVIAFRGTDGTFDGWKDSFDSVFNETETQRIAALYLNENIKWYKKYIICGHSKGGNLSIYSFLNCKKKLNNKITKAYSFDGNGLDKNLIDENFLKENLNKIIKFVPEEDSVGIIQNKIGNLVFVESDGKGYGQHRLFLWHIDVDKFVRTSTNKRNEKLIEIWHEIEEKISKENFQEMTNTFFNILEKWNIETSKQFFSLSKKNLILLSNELIKQNKKYKKEILLILKYIKSI